MKRMRKAAALLMVFAMVFALAGCGKSDAVGTWQADIDATELLVESVDAEMGDMDISFRDYVDEFNVRIITEFKEDGTYVQTVDEAAFNAAIADLRASIIEFYYDYLVYVFAETFAQMGATEDLSSREALEAFMGMTLEEAVQESMDMSMEEVVDMVISEMTLENLTGGEAVSEGKYKTSRGKLYMSAGLEYNVDPNCYELYKIEDGVMTISEGEGEVEEYFSYPYTMEKIA